MAENRSVCESCSSIEVVVTKEATAKGLFVGEPSTLASRQDKRSCREAMCLGLVILALLVSFASLLPDALPIHRGI